jgi:hypothetical protein
MQCESASKLLIDSADTSYPVCLEHLGRFVTRLLVNGRQVAVRLPEGRGAPRCTYTWLNLGGAA